MSLLICLRRRYIFRYSPRDHPLLHDNTGVDRILYVANDFPRLKQPSTSFNNNLSSIHYASGTSDTCPIAKHIELIGNTFCNDTA